MSDELEGLFQGTLARDLLNLCTGEFLGCGNGRTVCVFAPDTSLVIKFEHAARSFQNILEWETWERVEECKNIACWFAPCVRISDCGTVLLQKRTEPLPDKLVPRMVPQFFTDLKRANWGLYKHKPVCHDYGKHLLMEVGMTTKLRKADWWDDAT